jgi:P27 family predicted phage terminase small subunit
MGDEATGVVEDAQMKRGVKPKPTAIKLFEGDIHKERHNAREPQPEAVSPPPPDWMSDAEKEVWNRTAPDLYRMGVLSTVDLPALEAYCSCYVKWREAKEKATIGVVQTPSGYIQQNPLISVELRYLNTMRLLMTEFGMTPSSRVRTESNSPQAPELLEDLISGPRLVKKGG